MGLTINGFNGLDTDSMVSQLMYIEEAPLRNLQDKQDNINSEISIWQGINSSLDTLKSKASDLSDVFDQMSVTSDDEDVVTATSDITASSGSYEITVNYLAEAQRAASARQADSTSALNLNAGNPWSFDITIGQSSPTTMTIDVNGNASLNDIVKAINNDTENDDGDGNQLLTASIVDNTLVVESSETGVDNSFSFTDTNNVLVNGLGFDLDASGNAQNASLLQPAQDANFDVNGITGITRSANTGIDDVIQGVSLNLEGELNTKAVLNVGADVDQMKDKIKAFVDQYNAVQNKIDKYGGKGDKLQGDSTLRSIEDGLYNSVVKAVDNPDLAGKEDSLSLIGIEIDNDGKLSINDSKLSDNLSNNIDVVKTIFSGTGGVLDRLNKTVDLAASFNGYVNGKINTLQDEVDYIGDNIENLQDRLDLREERLRQQFNQMDQIMSQMSSQGDWLSAQFDAL